jgi:hypothetical protein
MHSEREGEYSFTLDSVLSTLTVCHNLGPMLGFFKYFRRKIYQKNWRFELKTKLNFEKIDHNIGF